MRSILELDPAWLGVYLELGRRVRIDDAFRVRIDERQQVASPVNRVRVEDGQRTGEFRDDLDAREIGVFVSLVLNGLALQRAHGEDAPSAELVVRLSRDAIGGPARPGTRRRRPS